MDYEKELKTHHTESNNNIEESEPENVSSWRDTTQVVRSEMRDNNGDYSCPDELTRVHIDSHESII